MIIQHGQFSKDKQYQMVKKVIRPGYMNNMNHSNSLLGEIMGRCTEMHMSNLQTSKS